MDGTSTVTLLSLLLLCGMSSLSVQGFLLEAVSCRDRCGQHYSASLACQCNSHCPQNNDCCPDYHTLCHSPSCAGKCGQAYSRQLPCQCNAQCQSYGNCCSDYTGLCLLGRNCHTNFTDVTEALWSNDVNRLDVSKYTTNFQHHVNSSTTSDLSPAPFFTQVDTLALSSRVTFQKFLALQDNYQPVSGQHDQLSDSQSAEVEEFLDEVLQTPVMHVLLEYLQCLNIVSGQEELRVQLKKLWFTPYPRHPGGTNDTSGFEHVMVGEYKNSATVNGLHNWLAFYLKERAQQINYNGYVFRKSPNLVGLNFEWNGRHKALGAFFLGTSPEFELALYTLCALTHQSHARLDGHNVRVQVYDVNYVSGLQIASAFPSAPN